MKKGFTLVELLAVIVILGIIAAITIPKIQDVLYESQDNAYDMIVSQIEIKANDYVMDKNLDSSVTSNNVLDVYLYQLISAGYIEPKDLEDPRINDAYIDQTNSYVRFTLVNGVLEYQAHFVSTANVAVDEVLPVIVFGANGNATYAKSRSTTVTVSDNTSLNTGSLKYLWNTSTAPLTEESFSTTFTNAGTISTPSGVTGGYYLWILAKDTAANTIITRTSVFNLDNTIPILHLTGSSALTITLGSTYTDPGATVTDNSGGNITNSIVKTGTVNPNTVGTYTITYNATDDSGNAATSIVRTVTVQRVISVEYLIIAGGAGGGYDGGGGGGAGGYIHNSSFTVYTGPYTIKVGAGGVPSASGGNSSFSNITAIGGGAGGANVVTGYAGGSGGGAGYGNGLVGGSATFGQGNPGGTGRGITYRAAGGGGAGQAGFDANASGNEGRGGSGLANSILGTSKYYAGGGGGGGCNAIVGAAGTGGGGAGSNTSAAGGDGAANTGSGGGGGGCSSGGGAGGSGIVIIKYVGPQIASGGTVATADGYTIHTFTTTGTSTFTVW